MGMVMDPKVIVRISDQLAELTRNGQIASPANHAAITKTIGILRSIAGASKRCPHCNRVKPVKDFGLDQRRVDQRQGWCRECKAATTQERRAPASQTSRPNWRAAAVCICHTAYPGDRRNAGACRQCGMPVVVTMTPRLQALMAAKYPPIVNQQIVWSEPARTTS